MIGECLEQKKAFGMVRVKESSLSPVGCSARVLNVLKQYEDGRLDIAAAGVQRFEIIELNHDRSFLRGEVAYFEDEPSVVGKDAKEAVVQLHEQLFAVLGQKAEFDPSAEPISFHLANQLPVDLDFKQTLLEMKSETDRIEILTEYYRATIPKVEKTLQARQRASGNGHVH